MTGRRLLATVTTLCAALALVACSGSASPRKTRTVFVDPPSSSTPSTPKTSTSSTPTVTLTTPAAMSKLPGQCEGRLPTEVVGPAIGESLPGLTAFVVGRPDASIKRISYINCKYGLASQDSAAIVEIQVSLYGTAAQAAARIAPTVTDYENNNATAKKVAVGGAPATILTGGAGADYEDATIVLAFGQRTVAISVSNDIAAAKQETDLMKLAVLAVRRTQ